MTKRSRQPGHKGCAYPAATPDAAVPALLIRDLAQMVSPAPGSAPLRGSALRDLRVVLDGYVVCENGRIASVGAMTDARGCVNEVSNVMPREYEIVVVWQGVTPSKAHPSTCGSGLYGDDKYRRVLVTTVRVGCLVNDAKTNTCAFPL